MLTSKSGDADQYFSWDRGYIANNQPCTTGQYAGMALRPVDFGGQYAGMTF
jgi:hypothetical protein